MRRQPCRPSIERMPDRVNPVTITQVGTTIQVVTEATDLNPTVYLQDSRLLDGTPVSQLTVFGDNIPVAVQSYPIAGPDAVDDFYCDDSAGMTDLTWVNASHVNSQVIAGRGGATMQGGSGIDTFVGGSGPNVFVGGTGFTKMFGLLEGVNTFYETHGGSGVIYANRGDDPIYVVPDGTYTIIYWDTLYSD